MCTAYSLCSASQHSALLSSVHGLAHLLCSLPHGTVENSKYIFMLKMRSTGRNTFLVITRNTPLCKLYLRANSSFVLGPISIESFGDRNDVTERTGQHQLGRRNVIPSGTSKLIHECVYPGKKFGHTSRMKRFID